MANYTPLIATELMSVPRKPVSTQRRLMSGDTSNISYASIDDSVDQITGLNESEDVKVGTVVQERETYGEDLTGVKAHADWKPWPLKWPFLALMVILHAVFLTLILLNESSTLSFPYSIPDDSSGQFVLMIFLPVACAIGTAALWELIDTQIRRLAPYYALARDDGASVEQSLTLDYVSAFAFFLPFKAGAARQWLVAVSSTAYIIASSVLPAVVSSMMWMQWSARRGVFYTRYSLQMVMAAQVLIGVQIALAVSLLILLQTTRSGLVRDPSSLASVASMMCESPDLLNVLRQLRSYDKHEQLQRSLSQVKFFLRSRPGSASLQITAKVPARTSIVSCQEDFVQSRWEAHPYILWGRTMFILELVVLGPYIVVQLFTYLYVYGDSKSAISPTVAKFCFSFVLLIGAAVLQMRLRDVSMLQPFYNLTNTSRHSKEKTTNLIWEYASRSPLIILLRAAQSGAAAALLLSISNAVALVASVFLPALWTMLLSELDQMLRYGVPAAIEKASQPLKYVGWVVAAFNFIVWIVLLSTVRKPFLPRQPNTLLSQMVYLCGSDNILEDMRGTSRMTEKELNLYVKKLNKSSEFQWFKDKRGQWRVGIERSPAEIKYQYGQTKPPVEEV